MRRAGCSAATSAIFVLQKSLRYHRPSSENFRLRMLQACCSRSSRLARRSYCEAASISLVAAIPHHHQQPNPHINIHRSQPLHFPLCRSALHPFPPLAPRLRWRLLVRFSHHQQVASSPQCSKLRLLPHCSCTCAVMVKSLGKLQIRLGSLSPLHTSHPLFSTLLSPSQPLPRIDRHSCLHSYLHRWVSSRYTEVPLSAPPASACGISLVLPSFSYTASKIHY